MNTQATGEIRSKSVDFSHRINHKQDKPITRQDLLDGIEDAARQADAIICLMQSWHIADAEGAVDQINPEILFYSLESVSQSKHCRHQSVIASIALRHEGVVAMNSNSAAYALMPESRA